MVWLEAGLLLLNMRENRWCASVGRAHASNGVFYVVDLQARRSAACRCRESVQSNDLGGCRGLSQHAVLSFAPLLCCSTQAGPRPEQL